MTTVPRIFASSAALALLIGCESSRSGAESALAPGVGGLQAPINSPASENNAALSPDELSLYFTSDRPGGFGGSDIWVSGRACVDCPWGTPANLGPLFNGPGAEAGPRLSIDGHLLFFQSDRPGGQGSGDIYVSRRANTNDDFAWEPAANLGTGVNTAGNENAADYLQSAEDGAGNLYFNRGTTGGAAATVDFYSAAVTRDGETRGTAELVVELSDLTTQDQHASVRKDGREVFIASMRTGGLGGLDLWTSTRQSAHEPWSTPVNLGAPLNTVLTDQQPSLSGDGRTLLFSSNRPGGLGGNDLWIATRTPNGKETQ